MRGKNFVCSSRNTDQIYLKQTVSPWSVDDAQSCTYLHKCTTLECLSNDERQ